MGEFERIEDTISEKNMHSNYKPSQNYWNRQQNPIKKNSQLQVTTVQPQRKISKTYSKHSVLDLEIQ